MGKPEGQTKSRPQAPPRNGSVLGCWRSPCLAQDWCRRTSPPPERLHAAARRAQAPRATGGRIALLDSVGASLSQGAPLHHRTAGRALRGLEKLIGGSREYLQVRTIDLSRSVRGPTGSPRQVATLAVGGRPPTPCWLQRVPLWTVDHWPMANVRTKHSGVSRGLYPPPGVTGRRYPPPWGPMSQRAKALGPGRLCGGRSPGELSGGNWMAVGTPPLRSSRERASPSTGRDLFPGPHPFRLATLPLVGPRRCACVSLADRPALLAGRRRL
jgi:hypothetical protein